MMVERQSGGQSDESDDFPREELWSVGENPQPSAFLFFFVAFFGRSTGKKAGMCVISQPILSGPFFFRFIS